MNPEPVPGEPATPVAGELAETPTPPGTPTRPDVSQTLSDGSKTVGDASATPLPQGPPPIPDHELLYCAGRGSYGEVWLARNVMGLYRAVKIVQRSSFEHARPFEREFNGIKKFEPISRSHDGFVDILQVGRTDAYFYYVMELADDVVSGQQIDPLRYEAKTLRSEIGNRRRLPFEKCVEVGLSLAAALGQLHKHGLIHRDIKPSNIIFVNGQPKLADIGLVAEQSEAKSFVGTEGFIPPEGPGTSQADIYSLGKVLYEIATGKDRHEFPALPTALGETKEDDQLLELNTVFLKACQNDIHERYQTCEQMRDDLLLLRSGESVAAAQELRKRLARLYKLSAAGIALTLVLLAGFAYARQQTRKAQEQAARETALRQRATAGELAARRTLYAADMTLAFQAMDVGNIGRARDLLDRYRPIQATNPRPKTQNVKSEMDLRSWEWRYLWSQTRGDELFTLDTHSGIFGMSISPDGRFVAGSLGQSVKVWEWRDSRAAAGVTNFDDGRYGLFTPDTRWLVVADEAGVVRGYDTASWREEFAFETSTAVRSLAVSSDSRLLAVLLADGVTVWDLFQRRQYATIAEPHLEPYIGIHTTAVAFSPDSATLAFARLRPEDHSVLLWDVATQQERAVLAGHRREILALAFSPDGKWLASGSVDNTARIWEVASHRTVTTLDRHVSRVYLTTFSPDGNQLATAGSDQRVILWDTRTWAEMAVLKGHQGEIWCGNYTPDGTKLATGGRDGTLKVWSADSKSTTPTFFPTTQTNRWQSLGEGDRLMRSVQKDGSTYAYETWSLDPLIRRIYFALPLTNATDAVLSDDEKVLALGQDGLITIWDAATQRELAMLRGGPGDVRFDAFHPGLFLIAVRDGARMGERQRMELWDWKTASLVHPPGLKTNDYYGCAHSVDQRWVMFSYYDKAGWAEVWDWPARRKVAHLTHRSGVSGIAITGDGRTVYTSSDDTKLRVWDVATEQVRHTVGGELEDLSCLALSPDETRLAAGNEAGEIRLWDLRFEPPQELGTLKGHRRRIDQVSFLPDGDTLVSRGFDGLRFWRAAPFSKIDAQK